MSDDAEIIPHDPDAPMIVGIHVHCRGLYWDTPIYKELGALNYEKFPDRHVAQTVFSMAHDLALAPDAIDTTGALALVWTNNVQEARIEFDGRRCVARFDGGQRLIRTDRDVVFALYAIAAYLGGPEVPT